MFEMIAGPRSRSHLCGLPRGVLCERVSNVSKPCE